MNIQEDLDINDTVRVSSRCFEVSPFLERYDSPDMVRGVYAGRFFTIYNGEDPVSEVLDVASHGPDLRRPRETGGDIRSGCGALSRESAVATGRHSR